MICGYVTCMKYSLFAVFLLLGAAPATTSQPASPYVRALALVQKVEDGPDAALIDLNAPLNDRTAAFLDRNAEIFSLLHEGATAGQSEWRQDSGDTKSLMKALNPVRAAANMGVLRAKMLFQRNDDSAALDELMDVLAMGRNVSKQSATMVASLVDIGVEQQTMNELAREAPKMPADLIRTLPDRLKQLPAAMTLADVARGERQFGAQLMADQIKTDAPKTVSAMAPFYEAIEAASDQKPPPTSEEFKAKLVEAIGKIDDKNAPMAKSLAASLVPSWARYYQTFCLYRAHLAMLETGALILRDGNAALNSSSDPFGDGPFDYQKTAGGFALGSKLMDKNDEPVGLRFGR